MSRMIEKVDFPEDKDFDDDPEDIGDKLDRLQISRGDLKLIKNMKVFTAENPTCYEAHAESLESNSSFQMQPKARSGTSSSAGTYSNTPDIEEVTAKFGELFSNLLIALGMSSLTPETPEYIMLRDLAEKTIFDDDVSVRYHSLCDLLIQVIVVSGRKDVAESIKVIHETVNVAFNSVTSLVDRAKEVEQVSKKLIKKMEDNAELTQCKEVLHAVKQASLRWLAVTTPDKEVVRLNRELTNPLLYMDDQDYINLLTQGSNYCEASDMIMDFVTPMVRPKAEKVKTKRGERSKYKEEVARKKIGKEQEGGTESDHEH